MLGSQMIDGQRVPYDEWGVYCEWVGQQQQMMQGFMPPMASALDEGSDRDPPRRLEWREEAPSRWWLAWDWTVRAFALWGAYSLVRLFV